MFGTRDNANLTVLQCWSHQEQADEVTAGSISDVDIKMGERFDWIVYDTGELDSVFTGKLLGAIGKAVFVTSESEAAAHELTMSRIEQAGAMVVGCVENNRKESTASEESTKVSVMAS